MEWYYAKDLPIIVVSGGPNTLTPIHQPILHHTLGIPLSKNAEYESQMQYGSIGWSVGALLGVAIAMPKRKTIGLIGDGSFQMTAQEISTFIRYKIPAIIFRGVIYEC